MANLIQLAAFRDKRGSLTVIDDVEKVLPFRIKRIFYIFDVDDSVRGGHRHHTTVQAAICIKGSCVVYVDDSIHQEEFLLDSPTRCLILDTKDWHQMYHFMPGSILLVMASTNFDPQDYVYEPYKHNR